MSILNLSNYKSPRYNPGYLKLLPIASRERPPQATEFEDIQDITINPICKYSKYTFNNYEVISGLKITQSSNNSITVSPSNILINEFPLLIQTEQFTITESNPFTLYILISISKQDNKYVYDYVFNTVEGYPLIQVINDKHILLYKSKVKDYIKESLFEIYGNFISWGFTYRNQCVSPGVAYINGNKVSFPYHTKIITDLLSYRLVIKDKSIIAIDKYIKLDLNREIDLGVFSEGIWTPNLSNQQIRNKDIILLEDNLNKLRDYLLETRLLKPIDTTSNLIVDTFINSNNADTNNLLFDCDIEQGNLILNKFSRITKDISISNIATNIRIVNTSPNVIIQDYINKTLISQPTSSSFITVGSSNKGILKLGPSKLQTDIYSRSSDKTILLNQTLINAEVYGLTPNSSDFRLTIGSKIINVIITTDAFGKASFSFSLPKDSSINEIITVQNNTSSATSSLSNTIYPIDTSYIGQVINIDEDNTTLTGGSICIRKVNSASPLIKILLAKYNDKPQEILAQTIVNNNLIKTSVNGSLNTEFDWELPITLSKGTYCLIISSINSSVDLFISNQSVLNNSYLFSSDANQTGITNYLNQDLKFELYTAIYTKDFVSTKVTVTDNIDKFDEIYYPGKFRINNIEYINKTEISPTNTVEITLDVNKYRLVEPVLISSNKNKSTYISKTIRTNSSYTNIYLELDAIILDSTRVKAYISSNETYTWHELQLTSNYLIDGNDQTRRYIYSNDLQQLTNIINKEGKVTQATRNYLTIRIDLETESNNKPIVKGYKSYVR